MESKTSITILLFVCFALAPLSGYGDFGKALSFGGTFNDVEIYRSPEDGAKTYAYVAQGANLYVYDITDLENPQKINQFQNGMESFYSLAIGNGVLAAGAGVNGTFLYSLENPQKPKLLTKIGPYFGKRVDWFGDLLIVTETERRAYGGPTKQSDLQIFYDVVDPAHPIKIDTMGFMTDFYGKTYPIFYPTIDPNDLSPFWGVCYGTNYLMKYFFDRNEVTNQYSISYTLSVFMNPPGLIPSHDCAYITMTDRFSLYQYTGERPLQGIEDRSFEEIDSIPYEGIAGGAVYDGTYAYLPIQNGAQCAVIDISKPDSIQEIVHIETPFAFQKIDYGIGFRVDPSLGVSLMEIAPKGVKRFGKIVENVLDYPSYPSYVKVTFTAPYLAISYQYSQTSDFVITSKVSIYRIHEDLHPEFIKDSFVPGQVEQLSFEGERLLVDTKVGLFAYDVKTGTVIEIESKADSSVTVAPQSSGEFTHTNGNLQYVSEYVYDEGNRISVFAISQEEPVLLDEYILPCPEAPGHPLMYLWTGSERAIVLLRNFFCEVNEMTSIRHFYEFDISQPSTPKRIDYERTNIHMDFLGETNRYLLFISETNGYFALPKPLPSSYTDAWFKYQ